MKKTTNNRGFTLVEMMVVVILLSIVSVLLFQTWQYIYTSQKRAEMLYIQQNAANQVAEWIEANVSTATRVEITQRVDATKDPDYMYIYSSEPDDYENNQIEYWYHDGTSAVTGVVTDVPLELNFYTIGLNKDRPTDDSKAMVFTVDAYRWDFDSGYSTTDYSYQTESLVSFPNMARAMQAQKTGDSYTDASGNDLGLGSFSSQGHTVGGAAIKFKSGTSVSTSVNIEFTGSGCFIATAAYGSANDDMVATLRMFRDEVLLQTDVGTAFVNFYYRVSPPIAAEIAQSPVAKWMVRTLLSPLVVLATLLIQPLWIGVLGASYCYWWILKRYVRPKGNRLYDRSQH